MMDSSQPGASGLNIMTRKELFTRMQGSDQASFEGKLNHMEQEILRQYSQDDQNIPEIKQKLCLLKHQFKQRWLASHLAVVLLAAASKTTARFEKNNADWLAGTISLPIAGTIIGRPQKSFIESSERSKRRKTMDLRSKDLDELTYATQMKFRKSGKVHASKIVKELTKSPQRARKYAVAMKKSQEQQGQPRQLSPLQALSMFTEAGLTKAQYERIRETNKSFFPCYSVIQKAKNVNLSTNSISE